MGRCKWRGTRRIESCSGRLQETSRGLWTIRRWTEHCWAISTWEGSRRIAFPCVTSVEAERVLKSPNGSESLAPLERGKYTLDARPAGAGAVDGGRETRARKHQVGRIGVGRCDKSQRHPEGAN